jgi:ATF/CREB family transcription factor
MTDHPIDVGAESKISDSVAKSDTSSTNEPVKPLAPPPRPEQQQQPGANTPDYFNSQLAASLSLEPNPFEQSFGGAPPETPGGTKLPPVAALTSPSSLLQGTGTTPFNWGGGSLRTGPLSPAMLSGPANDYFGDTHHLRGGFPTPNESSLRTGLTPGGSGSMFPAPSPNSQALFSQLAGNGATPGTLDFQRTALTAAAAKQREQSRTAHAPQSVTSQPQVAVNGTTTIKTESKAPSGPFDPHDNDAANGLFLLAQGRNGGQTEAHFAVQPTVPPQNGSLAVQPPDTSPQLANGNTSITGTSGRGVSEGDSVMSDESEPARPNTRAKGKRTASAANVNGARRKEDAPVKAPASKKAKTNGNTAPSLNGDYDNSDDDMKIDASGQKVKMTDEEKRKNFLERNR